LDVCKYLCEKCHADPTILTHLGYTACKSAQTNVATQSATYLEFAQKEYVKRKEMRFEFLCKIGTCKFYYENMLERNLLWIIFAYGAMDFNYQA
jgi:hypothetical protein